MRITGGCLCGALRYEAEGPPRHAGFCCCADCRKASGSGFIPFMGFEAAAIRFTGPAVTFKSPSARGGEAARNRCGVCGSLVFGGVIGEDERFTVYAGSLDDPRDFEPRMAIFTRDCPAWVTIPEGLTLFEGLPG